MAPQTTSCPRPAAKRGGWALRTLLLLGALLMSGVGLQAQTYQSSFSEVKFNRAKGPATFIGGVRVDAASGAASMDIPFGPGIGARGVTFQPRMTFSMSPQVGISSVQEQQLLYTSLAGIQYWTTATVDSLYQRAFGSGGMAPGTLDIPLYGAPDQTLSYSVPGGGGTVVGTVPAALTPAAAQQLIARFGIAGTLGTLPGASNTGTAPFIQMGSGGHVILGLNKAGPSHQNTDEVQDWVDEAMTNSTAGQWRWPRRVLVVQGDVAYEMSYVSHRFVGQYRPYIVNSNHSILNAAHYVLTKIANRFGESISFDYEVDGIGYTATWNTNPPSTTPVQIRMRVVGSAPAPAMPCLSTSAYQLQPLTQVRVTYQGISQPVTSFLINVGSPAAAMSLQLNTTAQAKPGDPKVVWDLHGQRMVGQSWGEAALNLQPVSVVQEATNEAISFTYAAATKAAGWDGRTLTPVILSSVSMPNRTISLNWDVYRYMPNFSPNAWGPFNSPVRRPAFAFGVTALTDRDMVASVSRTTTYTRVTPARNWAGGPVEADASPTESWVSRDFYTAITGPDGRTEVHRFMEPDVNNGLTGEAGLRTLAYLKHVEREVRYYESGVTWQSDLAVTTPSSSSAYKWVVKDRLSLHAIGNPTGSPDNYAVPYPTRTRVWDRDARTFGADESTNWSSTQLTWTQAHKTTAIHAAPTLTVDVQSLETKGQAYASPGATLGTEDLVTRTFDNRIAEWLFGRVATETTTRSADNTGNGSTAGAPAPVAKTQDSTYNTLQTVTSGDSALSVVTTLTYQGTSGASAAKLSTAKLTSPQGLTHSGSVGVKAYGYDGNGYLSSITLSPDATRDLVAAQAQDELGRPTSQTDAGGRTQTFSWDSAGRLSGVTPPGVDVATTVSYDDVSHRRVTLTRGVQAQEYVFNAFGELVLERRKDPSGTWSHRIFGFDGAGWKTGETIWIQGRGDNHETQWTQANLTQQTVVTTTVEGPPVCKKWGTPDPETGEVGCVQWGPSITSTTTTYAALYGGSALTYDARGRVIKAVEATGVPATTSYPVSDGFKKVVTLGGTQTTTFLSDAVGRLKQITDAKGQVTLYAYDASARIRTVTQKDAAGRAQVRTWNYNALGWPTGLVQPESGTTAYSNFTVMGKPQTTSYAGRVVRSTMDWMGRVRTVRADDGSVSQDFVYDTAPGGAGQLASTRDGSITTANTYDPSTGRLVQLDTTALGQTFTQTFGYGDGYGNRTTGTTSHGAWTQSYHLASGLPKLLKLGTQTVADTSSWEACFDAVSWMPKAILFGNGTTSSFTYEDNQARLLRMDHLAPNATVMEGWTYGYDSVGNLKEALDRNTGLKDTFGYDLLNRLTSATIQSPTYGVQNQTFDYDAFGNRTVGTTTSPTGNVAPSTAALTLDPASPALVQRNQLPTTMTNGALTGALYDAQGNLTQVFEKPGATGKVITLSYDALGRALTVAHSGKGTREVYQYRADGLRTVIDESLYGVAQKTRVQIYNDARQLVSQYEKTPSGSLTWKRDILYLGTKEAAEIDAAGMHVTHVDHLGSPRVVTGPTGAIEARQKYLPFGELLEQAGTLKTAKGYTNHEQTDLSGLIYMQARFYLPWYGRFASPDPARDQHFELTQSWNITSYVRNNPVMATDPTGMVAIMPDDDKVGAGMNAGTAESGDGNRTGAMAAVTATEKKGVEAQTGQLPIGSDFNGVSGTLSGIQGTRENSYLYANFNAGHPGSGQTNSSSQGPAGLLGGNTASAPGGYPTGKEINDALTKTTGTALVVTHGATNPNASGQPAQSGPIVGPTPGGAHSGNPANVVPLPGSLSANLTILGFCGSANAFNLAKPSGTGTVVAATGTIDLKLTNVAFTRSYNPRLSPSAQAAVFIEKYNGLCDAANEQAYKTFSIVR